MEWLAAHADVVRHERMKHVPKDLSGLCKYRVGDYRILYWVDHRKRVVTVYGVMHRREQYRRLRR